MDPVSFEPFEPADLADWIGRSNAEYIEERMAAGDTLEEATANAQASMQRTFPNGEPGPGQLVGRLVCGGQQVGELWVGPSGPDPERWWVWNVEIHEQFRSRGLGRKAMLLAEELARTNGAKTIGLNVFAHNQAARRLYTSLGYEETAVQMRKDLVPPTNPESPGGP